MSAGRKRWLRLILHGKAAGNEAIRNAVGTLREEGHRIDVRVTWEAGDAPRMAQEASAAGVEVIVAGGGDGTLNEVVSGVISGIGPPESAVGLLPLGTANDFAHAARIPLDDPLAALRLVCECEPRAMDVGSISGRVFVNVATGGFGTRVTAETSPDLKKTLGGISYLLTGAWRFNEFGAVAGEFKGPDFNWQGEFLAMAVGNGRQAGGGIPMCPEALLDDGLLDVAILPNVAKGDQTTALSALLKEGVGAIEKEIVKARVPWLEVSTPEGMHLNLDGEPTHGTWYRFQVFERWLRFCLPPDAPCGVPSTGDREGS
jgi:lipid kinase YegS